MCVCVRVCVCVLSDSLFLLFIYLPVVRPSVVFAAVLVVLLIAPVAMHVLPAFLVSVFLAVAEFCKTFICSTDTDRIYKAVCCI